MTCSPAKTVAHAVQFISRVLTPLTTLPTVRRLRWWLTGRCTDCGCPLREYADRDVCEPCDTHYLYSVGDTANRASDGLPYYYRPRTRKLRAVVVHMRKEDRCGR